MSVPVETVRDAVARIDHGTRVGIGGSINAGHPMALVREVIRRGLHGLRVVGGMSAGLEVDMLVAAGCVESLETSHVGAEDIAPVGPAFRAALARGELRYFDIDEALHLVGLRAAAQRLPFGVWTAALGTSVAELNPNVSVEADARSGRSYLRVEPIPVDVALLWAPAADRDGNVLAWAASLGDPAIAAAARFRVVQVDRIVSTAELLGLGRVAPWAADAVTVAPMGTHPFAGAELVADRGWLREYVAAAGAPDLLLAFLDRWFRQPSDEAGYLDRVGARRLAELAAP